MVYAIRYHPVVNILVIEEQPFGGVLRPISGGPPWGVALRHNPLHEQPPDVPAVRASPRLISWSGTPAERLFDSDPRAWGREAMNRFRDACRTLGSHGRHLLIRPHARHIISDVPRCLHLLSERGAEPLGIILDPASLLDAPMIPDLPDHQTRFFEALGPVAEAVWLTGISTDQDGMPLPAPLGEGILPADHILSLWKRCCRSDSPVILVPTRLEDQIDLIRSHNG